MTCHIAAFPKCFLDALFPARTMTWLQWTEMATELPHVEGLEVWPPALESLEPAYLHRLRNAAEFHGLAIPMMCASPDFTQRDPERRRQEIERQIALLHAMAELGGATCRMLTGQRRPEVVREEGVAWTIEAIEALLPHAEATGMVLVMENHYKDGLWEYPEFAQASDIFLEIVDAIDSPFFGVNYDPSNALVAGDDPVELLERVKHRVISMHASDRALKGGTIDDLRRMDADPMLGYAPLLHHGVVGQGSIDYDAIFSTLSSVGFSGWISIEDGQDPERGMEHLRQSAEFLHAKLEEHGLAA
ncbi:MAG TPA: sugar phosphate isomerase/epimerase family protein [Chloroflexota bacterium]